MNAAEQNVLHRAVGKQTRAIGNKQLPELPSTEDLRIAADLLMRQGMVKLNDILDDPDKEADIHIKAVNASTNISRFILAREQAERDNDKTGIEFETAVIVGNNTDDVLMIEGGDDDGDY